MTQIITVFDHQDMMQSHIYFFCPLTLSIIIRSTSQKKHPNVYKQTKQCLQLQSYTWYSERNIKGTSHGTHVKRLDPYTQTIRLLRSDFHNEGF